MKVLTHNGVVGGEARPLFFLRHFGQDATIARVISFGACNFACPYCKRDGAFRAADGSIITAVEASMDDLKAVVRAAVRAGEVVRLSGGDPVLFPAEAVELARYTAELGGRFSVAHNGSSPRFALALADQGLESAAIDLKAPRRLYGQAIGATDKTGRVMYDRSCQTQRGLAARGTYVDVRTPIFGHTTLDDMLELAASVSRSAGQRTFWTWRLYKPVQGCEWEAPSEGAVTWMIHETKRVYPDLPIGLRAKWEPSGFLFF